MTNVITYKGYKARIAQDLKDDCFIGHLAGINDVVGFHAKSMNDLRHVFREAVADYIETCAKAGKSPEQSTRDI